MKTTVIKKLKSVIRRVIYVLSLFLYIVCMFGSAEMVGPNTRIGKAETVLNYDKSYVMDDLKGMTIDGKAFDKTDYSFDQSKETTVLTITEYCYSWDRARCGNYGLYVYVYNPQGLKFEDSVRNQISLCCGGDSVWKKYGLSELSVCEDEDYEGLFYKYKVVLSEAAKSEVLNRVKSASREYEVSEIELVTLGAINATSYTVSMKYVYSGYASGYGANENAKSTLKNTTQESEVLELSVKPTVYRPEGTNGENEYTQDSLHSVYFAVPNSIISKYGEMTAVHATWLNAVLSPSLVTGNETAYEQVSEYLGKYVYGGKVQDGGRNNSIDYAFIATKALPDYRKDIEAAGCGYIAYNHLVDYMYANDYELYDEPLKYLYALYYTGGGTDSADSYTVSSEAILSKLVESKTKYGGELVQDKYAKVMFDYVDEEFTEVNIRSDETYKLTSEKITQNWWQRIWGTSTSHTKTFDGISAIEKVTDSTLSGTSAEVCKRLYVSTGDYTEFSDYCASAKKADKTVYIFRYQTSDYIAHEVTQYKHTTDWALIGGNYNTYATGDTNAYFFQQTVNLDFDIIDVTFTGEKFETVMPVAMSPIDVIPDATPPVKTTSDAKEIPLWVWILAGVLLLLVVFFIRPILEGAWFLIKIVAIVITLPIWGPIWIIKKIRGD